MVVRKMKNNIVMKKDAVSPVIGVILMVVISVVLAAVFYLWVIGLIGGGVKETPKVNLVQTKSGSQYNIIVKYVSRTCSVHDIKFFILDKEGKTIKGGNLTDNDIYGSKADLSFSDKEPSGKLSVGDSFIIKGEYAKPDYKFRLTYSLTGNIMDEIKLS
jgi:FlaG/FlaF family flagellin (archaellin)